jgi:hypothetical protein
MGAKEIALMQKSIVGSTLAQRPVAVFRVALAEAAAKERSVRSRRPDRVQAVAGLTDGDLGGLAAEFERLLRMSADANAMAVSLRATLHTLSPDVSDDEAGDA